ncbi:hypothetical protein GW17_00061450 [Ensete ventricosum]|nr:hypothetical protein GW17_00061450 [Ensete ventricosum]
MMAVAKMVRLQQGDSTKMRRGGEEDGNDDDGKGGARFGFVCIRKLVCFDREEIGKLGRDRVGLLENVARVGLLGKASWALLSRGLSRGHARRPCRGGGI